VVLKEKPEILIRDYDRIIGAPHPYDDNQTNQNFPEVDRRILGNNSVDDTHLDEDLQR
jgi:hypothetical protein